MKVLIIQTAFIGDAILASAMLEKLHAHFPTAELHLLVRKGNEALYKDHPFLNKLLIFDKQNGKYKNLVKLIRQLRANRYDYVFNAQRFFTTGLITVLSGGKTTVGFDKNPLSFLFTNSVKHTIGNNIHEVERNQKLIEYIANDDYFRPKLYPSQQDVQKAETYIAQPYVCIAPTSVWFTKQFPTEKWIDFINQLNGSVRVYLLGAPGDKPACAMIMEAVKHDNVESLAGQLSLLASAALMKNAKMNYVNDSAPMHLASAVNAPVCAVYCSTIPGFGFGPLSTQSHIVEIKEKLECRPCGLHGHKACPKGHFKCGQDIEVQQLLDVLK